MSESIICIYLFRNLLSNPLNCNCHLAWLSTWLRRSAVSAGNPRCEQPLFLRDFPVGDINPHDFRCSPEELQQPKLTCAPVRICPQSCICQGLLQMFLYVKVFQSKTFYFRFRNNRSLRKSSSRDNPR